MPAMTGLPETVNEPVDCQYTPQRALPVIVPPFIVNAPLQILSANTPALRLLEIAPPSIVNESLPDMLTPSPELPTIAPPFIVNELLPDILTPSPELPIIVPPFIVNAPPRISIPTTPAPVIAPPFIVNVPPMVITPTLPPVIAPDVGTLLVSVRLPPASTTKSWEVPGFASVWPCRSSVTEFVTSRYRSTDVMVRSLVSVTVPPRAS